MCSITFAKCILLLGYFYFSLNMEGKGKTDEHLISQIIFTRCLRLTFRTSKMPKKMGGGGVLLLTCLCMSLAVSLSGIPTMFLSGPSECCSSC